MWQPYPQDENAHRLKLDAFLARYAAHLDATSRPALTAFWQAFNDEDAIRVASEWPAFRDALGPLEAHGRQWAGELAALPELTAGLVGFSRRRL